MTPSPHGLLPYGPAVNKPPVMSFPNLSRRAGGRGMQAPWDRAQDGLPVAGGERWPATGLSSGSLALGPVLVAVGAAEDRLVAWSRPGDPGDNRPARAGAVNGQSGVAAQQPSPRLRQIPRRPGPPPRSRTSGRPRPSKLFMDLELKVEVHAKLDMEWSPEPATSSWAPAASLPSPCTSTGEPAISAWSRCRRGTRLANCVMPSSAPRGHAITNWRLTSPTGSSSHGPGSP